MPTDSLNLKGFMAHVLEELRAVENVPPEKSIYALSPKGESVWVTDPVHEGHNLVAIAPVLARSFGASVPVEFSHRRVDGLKLSGQYTGSLNVRALGRRYTLPLEQQRKGAEYKTPWIGYNYASMHKAVVKFMKQIAAAREAKRVERAAHEAKRVRLLEAIQQNTRRETKTIYNDLYVTLYEGVHVRLDAVNGAFRLTEHVTPENAPAVLDALEALHRALGTKKGRLT